MSKLPDVEPCLLAEVRALIEQSRQQVAVTVNATMTLLYWQVGKRINQEVLRDKRAEYGKGTVANLSQQLVREYGSGWSEKQLRHCLRFAETFPEGEIVSSLRRQLSWTHPIAVTPADYLTAPPPREALMAGLHRAIAFARNRMNESGPQAPEIETGEGHQ